jgi:hypothetical protein
MYLADSSGRSIPESPRWVFWSSRESVARGIPSLTACMETMISVAVYWLFSIHFNSVLPLEIALVLGPLFLLNSNASTALGAKWLMQWEKSHWPNKQRYPGLDQGRHLPAATVAVVGALSAFAVAALLSRRAVVHEDGLTWLVHGAIIGWISMAFAVILTAAIAAAVIGAGATAIAVAKAVLLAVPAIGCGALYGSGGKAAVGAMCGAALAPVVATIAAPRVARGNQETQAGASEAVRTIISALCMPVAIGIMFGFVVTGIFIRISATMRHVGSGFEAISSNFFKLVFCTSPLDLPELVPGSQRSKFSTMNLLNELAGRGQPLNELEKRLTGILFAPLFVALIMLPLFMARVWLKATAWFWWPLAYLSKQAVFATDPTELLWRKRRSSHGRLSVALSIFVLLAAIGLNAVDIENSDLAKIFVGVGRSMLLFELGVRTIQVGLITAALINIVNFIWVGWLDEQYGRAAREQNGPAIDKVRRKLDLLERLERLRFLCMLVVWLTIGAHAMLYWNAAQCWIQLPTNVDGWFHAIFGDRMPRGRC